MTGETPRGAYEVIGGDLPPGTCLDCDGCGTTPVYRRQGDPVTDDPMRAVGPEATDPVLIARWNAAQVVQPTGDGYHFVTCRCVDGRADYPSSEHP